VSRFRMAILLALVAVTALPTTAHARRIAYCHLFPEESVGRAVNYRGITVKGQETTSTSLTGAPERMTVCDFWSGRDQVAESTVTTLGTGKKAVAEFKMILKTRASDRPRSASGPWSRAYTFTSGEVFVLKGRHIFHIEYRVPTRKSTVRATVALAKRAAGRL
jgi:hypothetical protein